MAQRTVARAMWHLVACMTFSAVPLLTGSFQFLGKTLPSSLPTGQKSIFCEVVMREGPSISDLAPPPDHEWSSP